ncbi:hypothetical protein B7453_10430 [Pseudomonas sp. IB20]|uniref:phosphorylase family protein n=1 Tax=Pseudomonas sp. IB20 TaxID=1702250 RepID=UPI000B9FFCE7|nr:hypothetical protein [Pseudomonas sp. IB20]OZO04545.1 hypothetical protein B7453_10430 [Pseudomonas sp. IB20]
MRILIGDDNPARYKNLVISLEAFGVSRTDIVFSGCADDVQNKLEVEYFDLLILDILMPLYSYDSEVSHENSLGILFRINNDDGMIRPGKVVGITSDLDAAGAAAAMFAESTWSIINYSQTDEGWKDQILNCVKYIAQKSTDTAAVRIPHGVDLAIVCALASPEYEAVLDLPWNWRSPRPIDDLVFVQDGWFMSKGRKISVAVASASRMGMVHTALKSMAIISGLNPKVIAMTGICAGVKEQVSIGDVLVADPAWDFQSGKRIKDKGDLAFLIAPHHLPANHTIRTHLEQIKADKIFLKSLPSGFERDCEFQTDIKIGPVASGSAVLADGDTIMEIKKSQQRDLLGVEMEIYGLYAAAMASSPQPRFIAMKGVCDYADPDKKDKAQQYAAYASARVLQRLFEEFGQRCIGGDR